jgi:predicted metal-dependent peptidase
MTQVKKEMDAQLKISRAVTRAAFSHPFFGSCLLNLRVEESDKVPTMATDGIHVFWNRDFVDELTEDETLGVLCHEIMQ